MLRRILSSESTARERGGSEQTGRTRVNYCKALFSVFPSGIERFHSAKPGFFRAVQSRAMFRRKPRCFRGCVTGTRRKARSGDGRPHGSMRSTASSPSRPLRHSRSDSHSEAGGSSPFANRVPARTGRIRRVHGLQRDADDSAATCVRLHSRRAFFKVASSKQSRRRVRFPAASPNHFLRQPEERAAGSFSSRWARPTSRARLHQHVFDFAPIVQWKIECLRRLHRFRRSFSINRFRPFAERLVGAPRCAGRRRGTPGRAAPPGSCCATAPGSGG